MKPACRLIVAAIVLPAILASCSGDKVTAPDGLPPEGGPYDGTWALSWGTVTGDAATCRLPSMNLVLHQFGDSVAGTYSSHGDLACLRSGLLYTATPGSGRTGGHLADDSVQFTFSLPLFTTGASTHDSTLSGVLNWLVVFTSVQTSYSVLSGSWIAHRIPPPPSQDAPADIELYPDLPILVGGDSGQLIDTVRSAGGQAIPAAPVSFSTSDAATATIGPSGILHAKGGGLTLFSIIARSQGAYVDAVGINVPGPARMVISPSTLAMSRYRIAQLTVQVLDSLGESIAYVTPTYDVQPTGVVTLSSTGEVTASGTLGSASVIVQAGAVRATVPVRVVSIPTGLVVTPDSGGVIPLNDSLQMHATVVDSVGLAVPGATVTYASSNSTVLSVSSTGVIRSAGVAGFADITASAGAYTATRRFVARSGAIPAVVATQQLGGGPFGVAIGPTGRFYVGDGSGGGLYRGDLPSYDLSNHQASNANLRSIAFDSSGHRAFAAFYGGSYVGVIDVDSNRIVDSIDTQPVLGADQVISVAVSPGGAKLFVGSAVGVPVYDAQTLALDTVLPGYSVSAFSFHPTQPRIYVTVSGGVEEFDLTTLHLLRTWSVHGAAGTAVSPDGSELYVAATDSGLRIINLLSGVDEPLVPLPGLYDLKVLPGSDLIVADGVAGGVFVLDRTSRVVIAKLPVSGSPRRMALDPGGTLVIEANEGGWVDFIK